MSAALALLAIDSNYREFSRQSVTYFPFSSQLLQQGPHPTNLRTVHIHLFNIDAVSYRMGL